MKWLVVCLMLFVGSAYANPLEDAYGTLGTACTQDADADTGGANLLGPLTAGKRYVLYCHDGAGSYVACECIQGTSSVDASSSVGALITSPKVINVRNNLRYVSCVPFVDNQLIDLCQLN